MCSTFRFRQPEFESREVNIQLILEGLRAGDGLPSPTQTNGS